MLANFLKALTKNLAPLCGVNYITIEFWSGHLVNHSFLARYLEETTQKYLVSWYFLTPIPLGERYDDPYDKNRLPVTLEGFTTNFLFRYQLLS